MKKYIPSGTFKMLWEQIIEDLLEQACNNNINYCIRYDDIHIRIGKKFEEYRKNALTHMVGNRLDRHKLAACICGAIIEVQPLTGFSGAKIIKNANEIVGLYAGLNIIKFYMIYELVCKEEYNEKFNLLIYLKKNFDMDSPIIEENICDTKSYRENMANALYRSHHYCNQIKKDCYHFDIWAYSKLFYHLELYNKENLDNIYKNYIKTSS